MTACDGRFPGNIRVEGDTLDLGRGPIKVMSTYDPTRNWTIWWAASISLGAGMPFRPIQRSVERALYRAVPFIPGRGRQSRLLVSAPAKNADATIVYGVNHRSLLSEHLVRVERVMHHELSGPAGEGAERRDRH